MHVFLEARARMFPHRVVAVVIVVVVVVVVVGVPVFARFFTLSSLLSALPLSVALSCVVVVFVFLRFFPVHKLFTLQ